MMNLPSLVGVQHATSPLCLLFIVDLGVSIYFGTPGEIYFLFIQKKNNNPKILKRFQMLISTH